MLPKNPFIKFLTLFPCFRGVHVRPGYQDKKFPGRNITYFNSVQSALDFVEERGGNSSSTSGGASSNNNNNSNNSSTQNSRMDVEDETPGPLIFLHAGTYHGEFLVIDTDISLIGMLICLLLYLGTSTLSWCKKSILRFCVSHNLWGPLSPYVCLYTRVQAKRYVISQNLFRNYWSFPNDQDYFFKFLNK